MKDTSVVVEGKEISFEVLEISVLIAFGLADKDSVVLVSNTSVVLKDEEASSVVALEIFVLIAVGLADEDCASAVLDSEVWVVLEGRASLVVS